ncbi:MAG: hypothetical protein ABIP51_16940, partial [Bacteroidia bacterium]
MKLIRQFYPEETITKTLPLNIKKGDEVCFGEMNYKIQPSGLYHIKNVKISPIGIIYQNFISLKKFIICYEIDFKKYRLKYFLKSLLKFKKITLPEKTAYLIVFDNYSGPNGFA